MTDYTHLRKLLSEATEKDWRVQNTDDFGFTIQARERPRRITVAEWLDQADAKLIVAMRNEIEGLLDELEECRTTHTKLVFKGPGEPFAVGKGVDDD